MSNSQEQPVSTLPDTPDPLDPAQTLQAAPAAVTTPKAKSSQTVASATMLLMASSLLSGVLALIRIKYVNSLFGAGIEQDAYRAAFTLPDLLNYFLIGGAASISLVTVLNRYREAGPGPDGQPREPDDAAADRALSVILTTMLVVLGAGVLLGEVFAPQYVWLANKGFRGDAQRIALCASLTRIILPAQLFFFIGSVMSSRLQVRKIFIYQAFTPLIYNLGIIGGALLLHRTLGIYSLAWGVLGGVALGSALLNSLGAFRTGLRYTPIVGFNHPAFREWLKLSLPLMIGVSLVMFDGIFLKYFASSEIGGITLISNAKDLFNAPFNVIGPAAGAASLPFFASLFQRKLAYEFSESVARSVSRLFAVGLLVSAWMLALAPWLMDLFRGGKFHRTDAAEMTHLFMLLAVTLAVWAVQGIYARAFYAASDTLTPAITGTVVVALSAPLYWALFHTMGLTGLAIASDIGIVAQTVSLAVLLHRKRLVSIAHLDGPEIGRSAAAALVAFGLTYALAHHLPTVSTHTGDALILASGSVIWAAATFATLKLTGSKLPNQLLRRGR